MNSTLPARRAIWGLLFMLALPAYAFAGTQTYSTPGTYTFTVPAYQSLSVTVNGAGGGGTQAMYSCSGSATLPTYQAGSGSVSSFGGTVAGNGGEGALGYQGGTRVIGHVGTAGTASGGDSNTTGGGAAGGAGGAVATCYYAGYSGGNGGQAVKSYALGALTPGNAITVVVGTGGTGGGPSGNAGANGSVSISWTDAPTPPSCSVTFDWNPMPYNRGTIIRWSSANATSFSITNIGSVTPNADGSQTVNPPSTTDYSGSVSGAGGSATCPATLTVIPLPTGAIALDTNPIVQGNSTMLRWSSSDADFGVYISNIGWVSASGAISVAPSATTDYTMTLYGSGGTVSYPKTLTVTPAPSCTVSFDANPVLDGAGTTLRYSSANATAFTINNIGSVTPNTSGSAWVQPSASTDYTGTASNSGVNAICPAATGSPPGTLNVACTPAYFCSGQTIRYRDASCASSQVSVCNAPQYCTAGSSTCVAPEPSFDYFGNHDGHLEARPRLLQKGSQSILFWNVSNVGSCAVTGTNGDQWNGNFSGPAGMATSPIRSRTVYTLNCTALPGATHAVQETQTVSVVPTFQER